MYSDIRTRVSDDRERWRRELEAMIRIPSVSGPAFDESAVVRSAEHVADLMTRSGLDNVRLLELEGAHPAVFGEMAGPPDAPTVLLYAHHDVQPPGPAEEWRTDPFEPFEEDGRLYGRGSADDKGGIAMHLASLRALDGDLPVSIKLFVEGEEEIGSLHLVDFLEAYAETLKADIIVIGDSGNWAPGVPALTTSLRGLVECIVTVRTLGFAVHSGMYGGVYPDANAALVRTLARLHNDDGSVAVPGLASSTISSLDMTSDNVDDQMRPVPGLEPIGFGSLTSRLWRQPAISITAIESVPVDEAINQIVPEARAKVSMRVAPGQDADTALDALISHLEESVPWGAEVTIVPGGQADPFELDTSGPAYEAYRTGMREAYGVEPVEMGVGGSIPFVAAFADRFPNAPVLLVGVADPTSQFHAPNENVSLDDIESAAVAQAIALRLLGA